MVQDAIRRRQSFAETAAAVAGLRAAGVDGINLDLIYGLPHQSVASCVETVRQSLRLRPDRLAVFGYAHVPTFKKHQRHIEDATLPDGRVRQAQAEAIAALLGEAGYARIGLDHFALPGDALARAGRAVRRNFQGYTTDPSDLLIGFGASAIGRLPQGYVQNDPALRGYADRVAGGALATLKGYALTPDDRLRADLIERVMCEFRVDVGAVCRAHRRDPDALLAALASPAAAPGRRAGPPGRRHPPRPRRREGLREKRRRRRFDAHLGTSAAMHSRARLRSRQRRAR